jgi:type I restriction enzyme M protein
LAKRHRSIAGDWESIFGRLQELVLANSGEDEFQEIFKLVLAKLYAERFGDANAFRARSEPRETAATINALIAEAAHRWPGTLPGECRSLLADEHLQVCVQALEPHPLLDAGLEVMDNAFEFLISKTAKGSKGQYFTPRHVVDACVRIVKPRAGESIADPACGSAGFLVHALLHRSERGDAAISAEQLWGFDFDVRAIEVARALMVMAGDGQANVLRLNSLLTPSALGQIEVFPDVAETPRLTIEDVMRARADGFTGFDVILTNPPFAGEVRERVLLDAYTLAGNGARAERDVLFLERCVGLLKPRGRLAIVLPHNKFAASQWSRAREWLLRHMRVVAVLGLGRHTFLPHTAQKASVLFAEKRARPLTSPPDEELLFLISDEDGKDSRGRIVARPGTAFTDPVWVRADHDLAECVDSFDDFAERASLSGWLD